jgi:hypothetical protein
MSGGSGHLRRQLDTAWLLADLHLNALDTEDRPFGDVLAWVNLELTKNAAEIGYARFLYAVRR